MPDKTENIEIKLFLEALYQKYQYDFRGYSMASLKRRISQACFHFECETVSALQDILLHDPSTLPQMMSYLTVQVSELFRDPLYFKTIREKIIPHLKTYPSLKIWIAGCSTGEELYSFAILFREEGLFDRTIFYATDINHDALEKAQKGVYGLDRMQLFTKNYQLSGGNGSLSDYYTAAYNHAAFDKNLRKHTLFSDHSLATDEVFAEMNYISCRNVLIYFDRELQDRAVRLFTGSLSHKGFLGLGSKESLRFSSSVDAYDEFSTEEKIYRKKDNA